MNPTPIQSPRRQRGASLLEVLIAVLILAIGMLGVAALQAMALRNSQSSLERSQAVVQTYSILDAMRANLVAARGNAYNMGRTCAAPAAGNLVANDQRNWIQSMQRTMGPSACGTIACAASVCTITVEWNDQRATPGNAAQTAQLATPGFSIANGE